ncbi:hypothetical protein M6B38_292125 [Iris pallida]|uniref:Uncharacterized protein n=1 Tax=Iris pallida TaxID=29817 RepID=A0AAX6HVQ2_IRIPA|nr:hypothetical protein M6B38_292125 [Iris pallida]
MRQKRKRRKGSRGRRAVLTSGHGGSGVPWRPVVQKLEHDGMTTTTTAEAPIVVA